MREKVRHAQNLAKYHMIMRDARWDDGKENRGYEPEVGIVQILSYVDLRGLWHVYCVVCTFYLSDLSL